MVRSVNEVYLYVRKRLNEADIASSALEARELCAYSFGIKRKDLISRMEFFVSEESAQRLETLLNRRLSGEPLAYIIGEWDFLSLNFMVTPDVLIPRADTETLALCAMDYAAGKPGLRVLDLCCGSGCIGLSIIKNIEGAHAVLCDISEKALLVAKANIVRHFLTGRAYTLKRDLFEGYSEAFGKFDIIVCNPPYIKTGEFQSLDKSVSMFEPKLALDGGDDGLIFYRQVTEKWKSALKDGGRIFFECGTGQFDDVDMIMKNENFCDIKAEYDLTGVKRVISGVLGPAVTINENEEYIKTIAD